MSAGAPVALTTIPPSVPTGDFVEGQFQQVRDTTTGLRQLVENIVTGGSGYTGILDQTMMNQVQAQLNQYLAELMPLEYNGGKGPIAIPLLNAELPPLPTLSQPLVPMGTDMTVPDSEYISTNGPYVSTVMSENIAWIITQIVQGGTGLSPAVEDAIWADALLKRQKEDERIFKQIENSSEALGWSIPSGGYTASMQEAINTVANQNTIINNEIAIAQAKLAQDNTKYAHEIALKTDQFLGGYILDGQKNDIGLFQANTEKLKAYVQKIIGILHAQAEQNMAIADVYKAEAEATVGIYNAITAAIEAAVKQALGEVEFYVKKTTLPVTVATSLYETFTQSVRTWGTIMSQMCAAAQGSAHVGADLGYRENRQDSSSDIASNNLNVNENISVSSG